jgi:hypothetical protein
MGCVPGVFDIHHGANGVIGFDGPDRARGAMVAAVPQYQPRLVRTLTQMGVEYEDVYVRQDGRWWIAETRSRRQSCLIHAVDAEGRPTVTVMGEPPATFG